MTARDSVLDAIVVGGGFFGATIATYLAQKRNLGQIMLIEMEPSLLTRASYNNQARLHNGYHYPRSFTTAYRSRINLPRFVKEWPDVVKKDFTKLYVIARHNSKVTARQFERFCRGIGAKIEVASHYRELFAPQLIEEVFLVEEFAFDATKLASWAQSALEQSKVEVHFGERVLAIYKEAGPLLRITTDRPETLRCRYLFNCTYSGLNQFQGDFRCTATQLKHEITEMALIEVPPPLGELGVTVMDGPFFSVMPFPPRHLHTLSHVRYTPHMFWFDQRGIDPYQRLRDYDCATRVDRMVRDAARYLPAIRDCRYVASLFEVKTVLAKNEGDDGRPILFERHPELPGCYSILGGKIDNIYDVLEKLDAEVF